MFMPDGDLFTPRAPYPSTPGFVKGNDTSRAAAEDVAPSAAGMRQRVLDHIRKFGPCTCDEVEHDMDLKHQTASARIRELSMSGNILVMEERRKTRSGSSARVYRYLRG